jgi:hypothetical protein
MTAKEELRQFVDGLDEESAREALDYLRWLKADVELLSSENIASVKAGEEQIARGEYVTLGELERKLRR